jgi:hypothetical protein
MARVAPLAWKKIPCFFLPRTFPTGRRPTPLNEKPDGPGARLGPLEINGLAPFFYLEDASFPGQGSTGSFLPRRRPTSRFRDGHDLNRLDA